MALTTKQLFELAKTYWDSTPDFTPEDDRTELEWEDLTPVEQAAEAESIHAVVDKLVADYGYYAPDAFSAYTPRWIIGEPVLDSSVWQTYIDAVEKMTQTIAEEAEIPPIIQASTLFPPRTWESLYDIPKDVIVKDADGDYVEYFDRYSAWLFGDTQGADTGSSLDSDGPFTEVPAPRVYNYSWSEWEDVPVGVIVEGHGWGSTSESGHHNRYRKLADGTVDFWTVPGEFSPASNSPEFRPGFVDSPFFRAEWDTWADVPENVLVSGTDSTNYRKTDGRIHAVRGSGFSVYSSWNSDTDKFDAAKAPFVKVFE